MTIRKIEYMMLSNSMHEPNYQLQDRLAVKKAVAHIFPFKPTCNVVGRRLCA